MTIRNNNQLMVDDNDDEYWIWNTVYDPGWGETTTVKKNIIHDILYECWHQDEKYDRNRWQYAGDWLAIITSELGEVGSG